MGVMISAWQRGAAESRACNECLDVAAIILMRLRRAELIKWLQRQDSNL
jgi:hypothetical protein